MGTGRAPSSGTGRVSACLAAALVVAAVFGILVSSAGASPRTSGAPSDTSCTSTYSFAGNSDATVPCTTSTTTATYVPRLMISYARPGHAAGLVSWQACGYPPSSATQSVHLEMSGDTVGPAGKLGPGGCTSDPSYTACLAPGTYTAVAVVQGYRSATSSFVVSSAEACDSAASVAPPAVTPASPAASAPATQGGTPLALTGTNILLAVAIGLIAITIGLVLLRGSRRRRPSVR